MPFIQTAGIKLYYERKGPDAANAEPLLLISGSGGDLRKKPGLMESPLPKHFDTVCYDQRGLGQSDKPRAPTMADYAQDAADLMATLGWENAKVIGISFGGMVAQELAIRHPARVSRLVLCCTSPGGEGGASYPLHEAAAMPPVERARFMMPISDTRNDAAWQAANPDAVKAMIDYATNDPYTDEPNHAEGIIAQLMARKDHNTWDRLGEITCPTLICGGKYDGIALPETQEKMRSRIPNAELTLFEGGHLFIIQDRAAFPAMVAFLENGD